MISAKEVSYGYDKVSVLKGISFDIPKGDFLSIVGPNGAGKTTLAKLILGLLKPQKGSLKIQTKKIGYVPQKHHVEQLFPGTVKELLWSVRKDFRLPKELDIKKFLDQKFTSLSGGQQQRVMITLALQNHPEILVLDEPSVGVDIKAQKEFFSYLKKLNEEKGVTIVLITHDVGMVPQIAKTVLCINHNVCCMGDSSKTHELLHSVYGAHVEHHHHHHD